METDNPIINNPYEEPTRHYATDKEGSLNYADIRNGRRVYSPDVLVIPAKQGPQQEVFEINDFFAEYEKHLINKVRKVVRTWRESYAGTTRVTKELLNFWFNNPERHVTKQLFFAQREAIETAIWLNEVAEKDPNEGQYLLNELKRKQMISEQDATVNLPRTAFKMATGTGKTVVMAALILYNYFNRQEYRNETRYADYFLILTPSITIKDRLGVLFADTTTKDPRDIQDYYHVRQLVPPPLKSQMQNLNVRIIITNYHTFEARTLQGNKRSPFDGKLNANGEKTVASEDYNQVIRRSIGKFKKDSRLLIINDEAHHCYQPKGKGNVADGENTIEENARAAVWFNGLLEIYKRFKVRHVYDLSATPYYLSGSGYDAYTLFPWVVSDFGLIEAIESGLVKIPYLPESDNTQELSMPVLKNLYEHVKDNLPKKGQRRQKAEAKEQGNHLAEEPPQIPDIVKAALDQLFHHYKDEFEFKGRTQLGLEDTPPVFIIVCNNTSVSREMYKYIAGYELSDGAGNSNGVVTGRYDIFSNYDPGTKKLLKRPPTLLIDSDALENANQISDDFKKIFASEINAFKQDYRISHPDKSPENLTDADILREVVNTVGKKGALGSHIRCVVSVSMLTEGWDANTVTHIMGLRAFGSQLLCEQVAGRALRRQNYHLDKSGKFPPEYAQIIGIPFKMFKGGRSVTGTPVESTTIRALPERQQECEITFPNIVGYRVESIEGDIKADFSGIENFKIDGANFPLEATMENAFSPDKIKLDVRSAKEMREQELIYFITKELIKLHFADDDGKPHFQKFNKLKKIVETWYHSKIALIGIIDPAYKKVLCFFEPKKICHHIMRGILNQQAATDKIFPIFNYYNPFGSSKYVSGQTTKKNLFATTRSHVNYVVPDTESWEQKAAKSLEDMSDQVMCYVKNAWLDFKIPYVCQGDDRKYLPDFIARCRTHSGKTINLIIEVTGFNKDKEEKKWYVEHRWLPAVNNVREKYGYDEWHFVEVEQDIRYFKNRIVDKLKER